MYPDCHCFTSNQTGNTVLFAVGTLSLGGDLFSLSNIGCSLGSFIVGVLVGGGIGNRVGPCTRWYLLLQNTLQAALVFAAAGLQYESRLQLFAARH
jgi:uncharacterized membrane protein YoaK (UPF0700 family)